MLFKKFKSNDTIQVTVTWTATSLKTLMATVDATEIFEADLDTIWINPESDIRWAVYNSPTVTKGMKLVWSATFVLTWVNPKDLYLIASWDTACNVQLWKTAMI